MVTSGSAPVCAPVAACTSAPGSAKRAVTVPANGARSTSYDFCCASVATCASATCASPDCVSASAAETTPGLASSTARRAFAFL